MLSALSRACGRRRPFPGDLSPEPLPSPDTFLPQDSGSPSGLDKYPWPLRPLAMSLRKVGPSPGSPECGDSQTIGPSNPGGSPEMREWEIQSLSSIGPDHGHPPQPGDSCSLGWAGHRPAAHARLSSASRVPWPQLRSPPSYLGPCRASLMLLPSQPPKCSLAPGFRPQLQLPPAVPPWKGH